MSQLPVYTVESYKLQLMKALGGTLLAISCIVVALRVWTRTRIVRVFGWDDWFMLLTLAIFIGDCTVWFMLADLETEAVTMETLESFAALICAEQALYIAGTIVLKISLAFFFLRFLVVRWARIVVWTSVVVYSAVAFAVLLLVVFECGLPGDYLIKEVTGKCVTFAVLSLVGYIHGGLNALTDWVYPVLAIHFLSASKLSRTAKLSCSGILLLAVAGSIASIIRTVYIPGFGPQGNVYTNSIRPLIWTMCESGLGIIAASLATLRPLFQRCSTRTKDALQDMSDGYRSKTTVSKFSCFGSAEPLAGLAEEIETEKHDTMDLEMGCPVRMATKPLHVGILSSVATEPETNMTGRKDVMKTVVMGKKSVF